MGKSHEQAGILLELESTVTENLNRHLGLAKMWYPHEYIPFEDGENFGRTNNRGEEELSGRKWNKLDSKLSEVAQIAWHINLLTEDNLPSYHREIATLLRVDGAEEKSLNDNPWLQWAHRWTAEEDRHAIAMREFAHVTRAIDPIELEDVRMVQMSQGYSSEGRTPIETIAYVTFQELATRVAHRNTAEVCGSDGQPLAKELLSRISTDENLHMIFYRNLGKAALEIAPNIMMQAIAKEVSGFKMPGKNIPGFREKAVEIALADIYNHRLHRDDVLLPVLDRHWKITEIGGLNADGERAQQEIGESLNALDGAVSKFSEMQEAVKAFRTQQQEL